MKRTLTSDTFKEIAVSCSFLSNLPLNPETQTNLKSLVLFFQFQGKNFGIFSLWISYVLHRANVYHVSYHLGQLTNHERRTCTHPRHSSTTYSTSIVINIFFKMRKTWDGTVIKNDEKHGQFNPDPINERSASIFSLYSGRYSRYLLNKRMLTNLLLSVWTLPWTENNKS